MPDIIVDISMVLNHEPFLFFEFSDLNSVLYGNQLINQIIHSTSLNSKIQSLLSLSISI